MARRLLSGTPVELMKRFARIFIYTAYREIFRPVRRVKTRSGELIWVYPRASREAVKWFLDDDEETEWPISFEQCGEVLGCDMNCFIRKVRLVVEDQERELKKFANAPEGSRCFFRETRAKHLTAKVKAIFEEEELDENVESVACH